jgi:hypothetical protein
MRAIWMAALVGPLIVIQVHADPLTGPPAPEQSCANESAGLNRASYTLPTSPDCCDGKLRCTQLLSTTALNRTHPPART